MDNNNNFKNNNSDNEEKIVISKKEFQKIIEENKLAKEKQEKGRLFERVKIPVKVLDRVIIISALVVIIIFAVFIIKAI